MAMPATDATKDPSYALQLCFDHFSQLQYYCHWGYTCCGRRECCQNYTNHARLVSSQWFWFLWATMIILVCCCSYIRRRQTAGDSFLPVAFYSNRQRRQRSRDGGDESEEELLAGESSGAGNAVHFLPPGSGDQSNWVDADWYRANKPPPYALACPDPSGSAGNTASSAATVSTATSTTAARASATGSGSVDLSAAVDALESHETVALGQSSSTVVDDSSVALLVPAQSSGVSVESVQSVLGPGVAVNAGVPARTASPTTLQNGTASEPADLLGAPPAYS